MILTGVTEVLILIVLKGKPKSRKLSKRYSVLDSRYTLCENNVDCPDLETISLYCQSIVQRGKDN
jgi:hypothetical protein